MTTLTLTAGVPPRDRLEQIGLWSLVGIVAAMQLSIAAAQILLAIASVAWLASHITRGERLEAPRFFWPLVAYAALTLASAGFSLDPAVSFTDCKQLVLLMLVPITYDLARGARANSVLSIILTIGAASALVGIVQYAVLNFDGLGRRPQGTLSHWMTYSGTLMLVICAATARLLYGSSGRLWAAFVMPALLVALSLTLTRGAWVGVAVGVAVLFLSKDFRLLAVIPIVVVGGILLAPQEVIDRGKTMFDRKDLTSLDRVAMLQAGVGDRQGLSADGRRPGSNRAGLPALPRGRRGEGDQSPPAQRADADRGGARVAGAGGVDLVRGRRVCRTDQAGADGEEQEPRRRRARRHGGNAGRRTDGVQLRRLRVPDAAPRDHHVAVRRQPRRRIAVVNISLAARDLRPPARTN